jgi:hypothetical protein
MPDRGGLPEHFSASWIRLTVKKRGMTKKRADSTQVEAALEFVQ